MERITVQFLKHEKYNPRKDYKHPTWFALSNTILSDPDFIDYSPLEFKALIYLFCEASKKKWEPVEINFRHAAKLFDITEKTISGVIEKLEQQGTLTTIRTESVRDPNVIRTPQTRRQEDRQTDKGALAESFKIIWNEACGKLPKVRELGKNRLTHIYARLNECSDFNVWTEVVQKIAASNFCNGVNDRGWIADFDFLIKPDTRIKVLEGKYDNRKTNKNAPRLSSAQEVERQRLADREHLEAAAEKISPEQQKENAQKLAALIGKTIKTPTGGAA